MSLEKKLQRNLEAAADALVVPEPTRSTTRVQPRQRSGIRFGFAAAAVVVLLAVPALLWRGGGNEMTVPTTVTPMEEPLDTASATPSTTVAPDTTTTAPTTTAPTTTAPTASRETIAETMVEGDRLVLEAELVDEEGPPTATVRLRALDDGGAELLDETVVGTVGEFFWHSITGQDAVCEFAVEQISGGVEVTVELLLSSSIGCSDAYTFELRSGELTALQLSPQEVAGGFVAAWQAGVEDTMEELADTGALEQAREFEPPVDPVLTTCDAGAGSVYCSWDDGDRTLILRVRTQPPASVVEVRTESGE